MISAQRALIRLHEGNQRFVKGRTERNILASSASRHQLSTGQQPFAIILGCSDSRVPAEMVFDQGLGDLFVIRVAGNVVAPSQIGSVEFAVEKFNTQLVVVLGHSLCSAVITSLEELQQSTGRRSPNLSAIVDRIRPPLVPLLSAAQANGQNDLLARAIRANIAHSVKCLQHGSQLIEQMMENDELKILGAEYSLETGLVDFFDTVPEAG